jgi:endonuclease/exonuclease/phosphatase (EEP) superfamily protein YafD
MSVLRTLIPQLLAAALALATYAGAARAEAPAHCSDALGQLPAAGEQGLQDVLEILSWNIQKTGGAGWEQDLAEFAGRVDLAFIQEASLRAEISQVLGGSLYEAFADGYTTARKPTGVMTLSTHPPSLSCSFSSREPWLRTPKATSVTEYPLAERSERLLAINLHAVNFALGLADFREQFRALEQLLERHRGPVILAGDLNTWSGARQSLVDALTGRHGLQPLRFQPDLRTTAFGRALDHIYVRGLQAEFARAIPVSSSDHNPLHARLRFIR